MKIAEFEGCAIHTFPALKTMIIVEPDAIFFRCLGCGEIKSVHMFAGTSEKDIPWLKLCTCNAPDTGGDEQPLTTQLGQQGMMSEDAFKAIMAATTQYQARLVKRRDR